MLVNGINQFFPHFFVPEIGNIYFWTKSVTLKTLTLNIEFNVLNNQFCIPEVKGQENFYYFLEFDNENEHD